MELNTKIEKRKVPFRFFTPMRPTRIQTFKSKNKNSDQGTCVCVCVCNR